MVWKTLIFVVVSDFDDVDENELYSATEIYSLRISLSKGPDY